MKIVFVSDIYNHHQSQLAFYFDFLTKHKFWFVETKELSSEKQKLGWGSETKPTYVVQYYRNKDTKIWCNDLIVEADVVIWGSCPFELIRKRLKERKLTFAYSERLFKKKGIKNIGRAIKHFMRLCVYKNNHFLLCSSAYAADDYNRLHLFKDRTFKWGYFPELIKEDIDSLIKNKDRHSIVWVARFIDWKHPEIPVLAAIKIKEKYPDFTMNLIGNGKLKEKIQKMIEKKALVNNVHILGSMSPKEVRKYMKRSQVFLMTSGRNEGWGAVLNEAMNSGCASIVNKEAGAVPYLIEENFTGVFASDVESVVDKIDFLFANNCAANDIGHRAYEVICREWNAEVAATRLIEVAKIIKNEDQTVALYESGPMSLACKNE